MQPITKTLIASGAGIIGIFCCSHAMYTLYDDFIRPTYFTPVSKEIEKSLKGEQLKLAPGTDFWKAWIGFNYSHSLGGILFSGLVLRLIIKEDIESLRELMPVICFVPLVYAALAKRYWFDKVFHGLGLAFLLVTSGYISFWNEGLLLK
eukprot:TRINITY_DN671_c0_g2_i1.p1 TRINITY_DN671_c0_g2~~TRINITY_DN671_c0_g2_i1.p1  ORF type:complete len:149 (+),score=8.77 TRINITY_DN671_c0_g2_i1:19-465(+)